MIKLQRQAAPASSRFARVRSRSPCIFVFCEQRTRLFLVAVDLPEPRALKIVRAVGDEALHVLRRVAEKQPDLMGELFALTEAAGKPRHTARTALIAITRLPQQLGCLRVPQIPPQLGGAIEVEKCLPRQKADRQQAKPLGRQPPVQLPDIRHQCLVILAGEGKQAPRLDSRQCRRTLTDQYFFRHSLSPPFAVLCVYILSFPWFASRLVSSNRPALEWGRDTACSLPAPAPYDLFSSSRSVIFRRLMPSVDPLCSSAEVVGGSTPATPSAISVRLKPTMKR